MTNEHTSLEKYTSHTLYERVVWELETEQTATYWLPVRLYLAALLSHSAGLLNWGYWGPLLCWELVLTASNSNKLTPTNALRIP